MADQGKWFKLWCSTPSDDSIQKLSPALRWAWATLGCHTKAHGTRGKVTISLKNMALAAQMGVQIEHLKSVILELPNVVIEKQNSDNDEITVTWRNWYKYQEDTTLYDRLKRSRYKKRREEKRREENKIPPISPHSNQKKQAVEILNYLNQKTNRNYRPVPLNVDFVLARLDSGATKDQCLAIIDTKVVEWSKDPKMRKYLRPATLFNLTKFEQYLGELNEKKESARYLSDDPEHQKRVRELAEQTAKKMSAT